jgi:large subunit ribosomal protein L10
MSKYVKSLLTDNIREKLEGVESALVVNVIGLNAGQDYLLRKELRSKNIHLMVVRNSLAARATEGTLLNPAFEGLDGTAAVVWGGEDIVSLAKEIIRLSKEKVFTGFEARGGALDGQKLTADDVEKVSKWPSRAEQLSILCGQILSPGANLVSQLTSVGGALASQIKQKGEEAEGGEGAAAE